MQNQSKVYRFLVLGIDGDYYENVTATDTKTANKLLSDKVGALTPRQLVEFYPAQ